jgi:hypothetical protein
LGRLLGFESRKRKPIRQSIKEEDGDRIGEEEELKGDWDWGFD